MTLMEPASLDGTTSPARMASEFTPGGGIPAATLAIRAFSRHPYRAGRVGEEE
jgi:hypothetical protein